MSKLFFLMIFILMGSYPLRADEGLGSDQEFSSQLDNIKNPFEDGLPKPVIIVPRPVYVPVQPKSKPKPKPRVPPPVKLPSLKLQGVLLGDDMQEAIINDQIVPLQGTIKGARVIAVFKQGVLLFYRKKEFFLSIAD